MEPGTDGRDPVPRPRLALVAGAYGDEPGLAFLRRGLRGLDVVTVEPPDVNAPDHVLREIGLMAGVLAGQVSAAFPLGTVHVAGFSYGGVLAMEVASILASSGREIGSLVLLDTPFDPDACRHSYGPKGSLAVRAREALLMLPGRWRPARVTAARFAMASCGKRRLTHAVRRRLLFPLREAAFERWTHTLPAVPTLLVLGDGLGTRNEAAWRGALPNARFVKVEGQHGDVLKGDNLKLVVAETIRMLVRDDVNPADARQGRNRALTLEQ